MPFFCLLAGVGALASEHPSVRLGIMTDTHIADDAASCGRVKMALELFRRGKCDVIVHNGDIAEKFSHAGYRALRGVVDGVFANDSVRPREIWTYAWHDAYAWNDRPRAEVYDHAAEAWQDLKADLLIPHHHTETFVFGGYTFLLFPQFVGMKGFLSWADYGKKVAEACRTNPGKPVFVIDHVPPQGTVHDSGHWGDPRRRKLFEKYPQVVLLTGHTHGSVASERQIWQGAFTVLNAGCLQHWSALLVGNEAPPAPKSYGVLTLDIREGRALSRPRTRQSASLPCQNDDVTSSSLACELVVRRWDVRDGREAGAPWRVPLPFDAATAPWNPAHRAKVVPAPQFATDATVAVSAADKRNTAFDVTFPDVAAAETFRVEVLARDAAGAWTLLTRRDASGAWWQTPEDRPARISSRFDGIFFRPKTDYLFRVTPVNAPGVAGRPIETAFMTPETLPEGKCVWSSEDLKVETLLNRSSRVPLPKGIFAAPKGTKIRCVVEVETRGGDAWNPPMLRLTPGEGLSGGGSRQVLLAGSGAGRVRYLLTFWKGEKTQTPDSYDLELTYGAGTKVVFGSCRVFQ